MRIPTRRETLVAALGGVSAVAGSYAAAGYTRSFVVAPIDAQVVFWTPGPVVTFAIENLGAQGHLLHIALSVAIAVGLFAAVSFAGLRASDAVDVPLAGGALGAVVAWGLATALTAEPVLALGPAVPVGVLTTLGSLERATPEIEPTRRRTLGTIAGTLAFVGAAVVGGTALRPDRPLPDAPNSEGSAELMERAGSRELDLETSRLPGLVSSIGGFYNVDIAEFDPNVPAETWSLTLRGEVEAERTISYDELIESESENRLVTLRCVGEDLNAQKLDTAVWTGVPIRPLIESVDPNGECGCAMLRGEDGYSVQFPVEVLADGFLAWGMNGKQLPQSHGYPVRILIPGHWGETNVKWLTEIELLEEEADGYWEQRGWQGTGTVKTVAKLWDEGITTLDDGRIELAGHAYAGTRGIDAVEVSVDGGETWADADLSEPLPDEDVWRQWRYTFEPSGSHEAVVRAIDGEGNVQIREESDPSPSGASGWVHRSIDG
jgi:DMSO/TMAO reductase YedYZ molybdopterin-dependent catalytic subunit